MRAFIGGLDTFLGAALAEALAKDGYDIVGTANSAALAPAVAKMVVKPLPGPPGASNRFEQIDPLVKSASIVIYVLAGREHEARSAILSVDKDVDPAAGERVFIGISNPISWGCTLRTPTDPPPPTPPPEGDPSLSAEPDGLEGAGSLMEKDRGELFEGDDKGEKAAGGDGKGGDGKGGADAKGAGGAAGELFATRPSADLQRSSLATISEGAELPGQMGPVTLTAAMEGSRKPMVIARDLISVERVIMRAHKPDHLRTHVVCPGMVYGGGEDDLGLHPLFKLVFESPDDPLKLLTPGANVLPLIHIADLVAYVQGVLSGAPPERYLLACEPGRATLKAVSRAISTCMGGGQLAPASWQDVLARPDVTHLLMHVPFECTRLPEGRGPSFSEDGFLDRVEQVAEEYKAARGLRPLRVVLQGPPASGKTLLATASAKIFGVRRVDLKTVVEWAYAQPEGSPTRARIDAVMKGKPGRLPDDLLAQTTRDYLLQPSVATRGWILENFPKAVAQVEPLLASEAYLRYKADLAAATTSKGKPAKGSSQRLAREDIAPVAYGFDSRLAPTHVVVLECDDATLMHRTRMMESHEAGLAAAAKERGEVFAPTHNNVKDAERRKKPYADLRAADKKDLEDKTRAWESKRDALVRTADKKANSKDPRDADFSLERELAALGPCPVQGGLVGALTAEGAPLTILETSTPPPPPPETQTVAKKDPRAKMTKEEEERMVNELLSADVEATGKRILQLQRILGLPRNYTGFPQEWDPLRPLSLIPHLALATPVGGRAGPRASADAGGGADARPESAKQGQGPSTRQTWKLAEHIVALERFAEADAKPLRRAVLEGHGHRLTQYLLDDVMPSITTALLGIKDPDASLPDDPLSYLARMLVSGADERVQENIDPYASPLYKLQRVKQKDTRRAAQGTQLG